MIEQHAHRQALVLAQLLRHRAVEAQPRCDLVGDHLRRDAAEARLPRLAVARYLAGHAHREVAREALGHLHLHLERREVDHGEQLRIPGDARALGDEQLAHLAIDGRAHRQLGDLALQVLHQQDLARMRLLLGLDVEAQAVVAGVQPGLGMAQRDARLLQRVARVVDLHAGRRAGVERTLLALQVRLGRLDVDRRVLARALQRRALFIGLHLRAQRVGLQRVGRGQFLREFRHQLGAGDRRQHLALLDRVARVHLQRDGAGLRREQRRAERGDDAAFGLDVAHERAAADVVQAQALAADGAADAHQVARLRHAPPDQGDGGNDGRCDAQAPAARGADDDGVLRGGGHGS